MRPISTLAPEWWDFTTLPKDLLNDAAKLSAADLEGLSRSGFTVKFYDTLEELYLAQALEYIEAWSESSASTPAGICGPIGPTEQLPLVAQLVNAMNFNLKDCHFWGMDEWIVDGKAVDEGFPLSFAKADKEMCFNKIRKELQLPESNMHFPTEQTDIFSKSFDDARCVIMQGGQGDVKHWAFNDPLKREGEFKDAPPSLEQFKALPTRIVDLHPITIMQNARTSGGGVVTDVPLQAVTVGPAETWKTDIVSIWHAGTHDNPFGQRLTALMIANNVVDSSVPMSVLADHKEVRFSYYRHGVGECRVEMH